MEYLLESVTKYTLSVISKKVDGIKKYRACYQWGNSMGNSMPWIPIAGSRWEMKKEDAKRFLAKYATGVGAKRIYRR